MTVCILPDPADYPDREYPPEGMGDDWRVSETCSHDVCAEVGYWSAQYQSERGLRASMALAREDLDMPYAAEPELMHAIQVGLK